MSSGASSLGDSWCRTYCFSVWAVLPLGFTALVVARSVSSGPTMALTCFVRPATGAHRAAIGRLRPAEGPCGVVAETVASLGYFMFGAACFMVSSLGRNLQALLVEHTPSFRCFLSRRRVQRSGHRCDAKSDPGLRSGATLTYGAAPLTKLRVVSGKPWRGFRETICTLLGC